jgi:hypothetical protein
LSLNLRTAVGHIEKYGILLVYPIAGKSDPASLWSVAYPRSKMRWEWDDNGDDRVARLWHLREELSRSKKVVYAKWLNGRATFFSREVFAALLALLMKNHAPLSRDARTLLDLMEESSPRSTKELKRESGLQGRLLESTYNKAMKELWSRLLIVGFGEVDEGAFPSLAVGATRHLFEDLFEQADAMAFDEVQARLSPVRQRSPAIEKFLERQLQPKRPPRLMR